MAQVAIHQAKKALRRELKKRIAGMSDVVKLKESASIVNKLLATRLYERWKLVVSIIDVSLQVVSIQTLAAKLHNSWSKLANYVDDSKSILAEIKGEDIDLTSDTDNDEHELEILLTFSLAFLSHHVYCGFMLFNMISIWEGQVLNFDCSVPPSKRGRWAVSQKPKVIRFFFRLSLISYLLLGMEEYKSSKRISVYLSMPSEVQTEGILKDIFKTKKDCFIPRYIGPNMNMVKLNSMEDMMSLPVTAWNIKQPAEQDEREEAISTGGLDLIIVPGLGFTKGGLRLGRGKGYYDTYIMKCIEKCEKKPLLIGLAFSTQLCNELPVTERDMTLDHVISFQPD
ncbi:unnamed protein product [Porites evermanni]|uniref:5-formyltetrahydrofolate cyclo-ligase n=1 Tax=Porites evermanni TaxID=104178 RepID=A0ABN8M441_9CNID|nr:unnamed protein product [Porites evermanni]